MSQVTNGLRSILSYPIVYNLFQSIMGSHKSRKDFVNNRVKPFHDMKILDIGCGPADILQNLPTVDYWGFDISENYINQAKKKFGSRGNFFCKQLEIKEVNQLPSFDLVLALGLFHHLDDEIAIEVLQLASKSLKIGGRLLSVDPCFEASQNQIAKFLISKDRGQNVRDMEGYQNLAKTIFKEPAVEVKHQAWIPYTHCYMECVK